MIGLVVGGLVVTGLAVRWVWREWRAFKHGPDPFAPEGQRFTYTTPQTYDERQAIKSKRKAKRRTASGRRYRPIPTPRPKATVTPIHGKRGAK